MLFDYSFLTYIFLQDCLFLLKMADGFCERLGPSLLIISIASVCYMIGIATPYLIKIESLTSISNSGLWKRCSSSTYGKECYNTSTYAENGTLLL